MLVLDVFDCLVGSAPSPCEKVKRTDVDALQFDNPITKPSSTTTMPKQGSAGIEGGAGADRKRIKRFGCQLNWLRAYGMPGYWNANKNNLPFAQEFAVQKRVQSFLGELRHLEPAQYYYTAADLHLTVLPLLTATVDPGSFLERTEEYVSAVDSALREVAPIKIDFQGVTVSPGTVMIQGFPENERLNELRNDLRTQLHVPGLTEGWDRRYRLESAHMTVARFSAPLREPKQLVRALEQGRQLSFGATTVESLSLVKSDWYMSHRTTPILKHYSLHRAGQT